MRKTFIFLMLMALVLPALGLARYVDGLQLSWMTQEVFNHIIGPTRGFNDNEQENSIQCYTSSSSIKQLSVTMMGDKLKLN